MIYKQPKRIGYIMAYPEAMYQQLALDAVCSVCAQYGYDLIVWTMLVQSCHYFKDYLEGELNIYELINFDKVDAVLVNAISLTAEEDSFLNDRILDKLKRECDKPVAVLDIPLGDYPVFAPDETSAFERITAHVLDMHRPQRLLFLGGPKGNTVSERRLRGVRNEYALRGMRFDDSNVINGDFWYTSGMALAEKIMSGEIERPDAVICASDHMAIGLTATLGKRGYAPGDICVTGFDGAVETVMAKPTVTSYIPDLTVSVHRAINSLRERMDPDLPVIPPRQSKENGLRIGASCGCPEDTGYIKERLMGSLWNSTHNYVIEGHLDEVDLCKLLDSYTFESFTAAADVETGLKMICAADWLLRPYENFWLCLDPNWLDTESGRIKGYPDRMDNVMHTIPTEEFILDDKQHCSVKGDHMFDTKELIPALSESHEPSVFYFVPIHFSRVTLGYAVLQNPISQKKKIGYVFHNWIRNVDNALEMIRSKERLAQLARHDGMTGLLDRRGMEKGIEDLRSRAAEGDEWIALVIDMDGLKYINDNYGHTEGDRAIMTAADAVRSIAGENDIAIRAGGDEFYIQGVGTFDEDRERQRMERLRSMLSDMSAAAGREYTISVSIGCAHAPVTADPDTVISEADKRMYADKMTKKHR
ncbi:MAG: GGDEF domain-containing protein [Oscillospiraceae bacterium]|nr:GGDEF domain-containing protein [Oscillospiraceae bacterium]